jgi:hypothetical protein
MRTPIALLVAAALAPVAFAQTNKAVDAAAAKLGVAQAAGAPAAVQAGDDKLTCDQIQSEMAAIVNQSNVQGVAGQMATQLQGVREAGIVVEQANVKANQEAMAQSAKMASGPFAGIARAEAAAGEAKLGQISAQLDQAAKESITEPAAAPAPTSAGPAAAAAPEPAAPEPKKKGGFMKRFGQVAGAAESLGGLGRGAGGAASAIGGAASQLGGLGGLAGGIGNPAGSGPDPAAAIANDPAFQQAAKTLGQAQVGAPQLNALSTLGPEMARGNELMQLARSKGCSWAAGQ